MSIGFPIEIGMMWIFGGRRPTGNGGSGGADAPPVNRFRFYILELNQIGLGNPEIWKVWIMDFVEQLVFAYFKRFQKTNSKYVEQLLPNTSHDGVLRDRWPAPSGDLGLT